MYEFDEDDEAVLTCTATGSPPVDITWQYEGMSITSDGSSVTITNNFSIQSDLILTTGHLTYNSIQRSMAGTYTCVASNGIGSSEEVDSTVIVYCKSADRQGVYGHNLIASSCLIDPPSITSPPAAVQAVDGDNVTLNCTAEGLPLPNLTALVEPYGGGAPMEIERDIETTDRINESAHQITGFLILQNVRPIDTGNYTCNASNRLGSDTSIALVEVLGKWEGSQKSYMY